MKEYQNAGENYISSTWTLQRISLRQNTPRYRKQQFAHDCLAKFTGMRRDRSLFSTCKEDFIFSLLFITREAEVITSFYQVTAMKQIDTLIFDAVIKLRNNKKQPNENSIHT